MDFEESNKVSENNIESELKNISKDPIDLKIDSTDDFTFGEENHKSKLFNTQEDIINKFDLIDQKSDIKILDDDSENQNTEFFLDNFSCNTAINTKFESVEEKTSTENDFKDLNSTEADNCVVENKNEDVKLQANKDECITRITPCHSESPKDANCKNNETLWDDLLTKGNNKKRIMTSEKCKIIEIYESGEFLLDSNEDNVVGKVIFHKNFLTKDESMELYECLVKELPWQQKDSVNKAGNKYAEPRMTYWFGKAYKYSSVSWPENNDWHSMIDDLRSAICKDRTFSSDPESSDPKRDINSVMCNYYRDNNDSIGWHADDETSLGRCPKIASISLGQERVFEVCRREEYYTRKEKPRDDNLPFSGCTIMYRFHLGSGSLLIMEGSVQDNWLHRVPKEDETMGGRINLTFRYIVDEDEEKREIERKKKRALTRRREFNKSVQQSRFDQRNNRNYYDNRRQDHYYDDSYYYDNYHYPKQNYYENYDSRHNHYGERNFVTDRNGCAWYPRFNNRRVGEGHRQKDRPERHVEDSDRRVNNPPRFTEDHTQGDRPTQKNNDRRQRTRSHNDIEEVAHQDFQRFNQYYYQHYNE